MRSRSATRRRCANSSSSISTTSATRCSPSCAPATSTCTVPCRREQQVLIDAAEMLGPAPLLGAALALDDACRELARRLRAETEGEVLFDAASRGRYATDASIY